MPLVFKASSIKCAFFWRFFFWIILFRFKPANRKTVFLELTKFQKFIFNTFPIFYFEWKSPFSRKTVLRKCLWRSWCYTPMCKICSMHFSANIAVEPGVIVVVIVIALFIFTRFWCTPTHVQLKSSSDCDSRSRSTKLTRILFKSWATDWLTQLIMQTLESFNAFEKFVDFMSLNAIKCDCGSIFVRYMH